MANGEIPQYDLVGMKLGGIFGQLCDCIENLCECIQNHAQQPGVQPCGTFPFNISGAVVQASVCHTNTFVLQVPKGMTGVITRIAMQERYPGTLYGANFMLQVNDNLDPAFPRIDNPIGEGIQNGIGTRICLQEQDLVMILLQCSWLPVQFTGMEAGYQQTLFPFQVSGYYEPKQLVC